MAFKPGKSGNPNGVQRPLAWQDALRRALARKGEGSFERGLNIVAEKVVEAACAGDKDAWQEIANRIDGKVPTILGSDPNNPFPVPPTVILGAPGRGEPDGTG